ncbi:hypothetical protein Cgig2_003059 [Carnegiea gigantea]|uniref:Uncharacterized protein n=1 Tax=Carnegiea gigantea TaxID=171969 RepID=A0A9Q1JT15_9CARY|nr:hypothetical protein Cgig2_003059 [Carnegiea gigantea]
MDGPPAYPARRSVWRDIGVGSGVALMPLVTGPLPSSQKIGLMGCAAPPRISPGPSHHFSDMRLLSVTYSNAFEGADLFGREFFVSDARMTSYTSVWRSLSAGTQFWDENLQNELSQGRLSSTAFDRYCMVLFAGIAAEALIYGEAEGGENDENLFRSICVLLRPPLSVPQASTYTNIHCQSEFHPIK